MKEEPGRKSSFIKERYDLQLRTQSLLQKTKKTVSLVGQ